MKRYLLSGLLLPMAATMAWSGVVIEMDSPGPAGEVSTDVMYAQGKMLRMDSSNRPGGEMSMIFRGDELLMVEREKNRCQRIDEQGVREMSEQLGGMMAQMQEELAKMPPEQRKMMEKMMKDRMPGGMGEEAPPRRLEKGDTETVGDYTCKITTAYSGDDKLWEVCAAARSAVPEYSEASDAFEAMAEFTESLREMAMKGPMANLLQTPFSDMAEFDGVPVRVRAYQRGRLVSESTLKSVTRRDFDDDWFAAPKGCKVKNLADEMKRGR
jgi:hypothetical protein